MLSIYGYLWRWSLFYFGIIWVGGGLLLKKQELSLPYDLSFVSSVFLWFYLTFPMVIILLLLEMTHLSGAMGMSKAISEPKPRLITQPVPENTDQPPEDDAVPSL